MSSNLNILISGAQNLWGWVIMPRDERVERLRSLRESGEIGSLKHFNRGEAISSWVCEEGKESALSLMPRKQNGQQWKD